jgi:predicted transcriptional regulator
MFGLGREKLTQQYLEEYINEYGIVTRDQLTRIMENAGLPSRTAERYHRALFNYGKVNYDRSAKLYYSAGFVEATEKRTQAMQKLQWVLLDFLGRVEHHFPISAIYTPAYICMMLEDRAYELVYGEKGQEKYLANQLVAARTELLYRAEMEYFAPIIERDDKSRLEATKYIILLDDLADVNLIQCKQIAYFCLLDADMQPVYYSPEEMGDSKEAE